MVDGNDLPGSGSDPVTFLDEVSLCFHRSIHSGFIYPSNSALNLAKEVYLQVRRRIRRWPCVAERRVGMFHFYTAALISPHGCSASFREAVQIGRHFRISLEISLICIVGLPKVSGGIVLHPVSITTHKIFNKSIVHCLFIFRTTVLGDVMAPEESAIQCAPLRKCLLG